MTRTATLAAPRPDLENTGVASKTGLLGLREEVWYYLEPFLCQRLGVEGELEDAGLNVLSALGQVGRQVGADLMKKSWFWELDNESIIEVREMDYCWVFRPL